jgi:hypothetical protein
LGADRAYALQNAQMQSGLANNALGLIGFGQNASAIPMGAGFLGMAQQQAGIQGPQMFSPDAGVNLALAQQANQAGYGAAMAGGNAALAGATMGANSRLYGSAGSAIGGMLGNVNWGGMFGGSSQGPGGVPPYLAKTGQQYGTQIPSYTYEGF